MRTLAIETSCDDTSLAIVHYDGEIFQVEEMITADQLKIHNEFGGVVPEYAARRHASAIDVVIEQLGGHTLKDKIDFITVTMRPGLPGSLVVGMTAAHSLAHAWNKPLREVNHIMGHVFSSILERSRKDIVLPYVCLTVSGGHNDIYIVEEKGKDDTLTNHTDKQVRRTKRQHDEVGSTQMVGPYQVTKLGQTIDDAAGEVFDKVARMLGGPYPGGAWIGKQAEQGGPDERISFRPTYLAKESYDVSFSGLKSQVHYLLKELEETGGELDKQMVANIARAFQEAITDVLVKKAFQAVLEYDANTVGVVGGVSANTRLREKIQASTEKYNKDELRVLTPTKMSYCMDNAAMIGMVGLLEEIWEQNGGI